MNQRTNGLHLVPSPGPSQKIFQNVVTEPVSSAIEIYSVLNLYFEWPQFSSCRIYSNLGDNFQCTLARDQDEISYSEIYVNLGGEYKQSSFSYDSQAKVVVEIFRRAYFFSTRVTASGLSRGQGWDLILDLPVELLRVRSKFLPRVMIEPGDKIDHEVKIKSLPSGEITHGSVTEIGLGTIKLNVGPELANEMNGNALEIQIGDKWFKAKTIFVDINDTTFEISTPDVESFGEYFEIYRRVAYPHLQSRYELPFERHIDLYRRANYLGRADVKLDDIAAELTSTWEHIKSGVHDTVADYLVTDDDGLAVGSSSVALTHYRNGSPMWVFHQVSAVRDPRTVWRSGELYVWRAEYLSARPGTFGIWVTFRSQSRWVERIYVKHSRVCTAKVILEPMKMARCRFEPTSNPELEVRSYKIGDETRHSIKNDVINGGICPRFLNAGSVLDTLIAVEPIANGEALNSKHIELIKKIGGQLATNANLGDANIAVIVPYGSNLEELQGRPMVPDRYCEFEKSDLPDLASTIEHSMAVTEKKLMNG